MTKITINKDKHFLEALRSKTNNLRNKKARKYNRSCKKGLEYVCPTYKGALITSFYDILHLCLYWRHLRRFVFITHPIKDLLDTYRYKKLSTLERKR